MNRAIRTVMFTDLVDSTKRRTTAGDDTVDQLLDSHHRDAQRIGAEYGATIVKDTGDGCLVVFGSARSAIDAALALHREPAAGSFRIGIHAGDVREDGDVRGEAVNAASRITALAQGGQILVSQVVRELAGTVAAQIVEHGTFELRGFPRPWTLYLVRAGPVRPPWRVAVLGDGLVERHGVVVEPLSTGRVTRLLGRLALAPMGRIERARLAFELWPDSSESQARTNLRKLLHEIRVCDADGRLVEAASSHVSISAEVAVDVRDLRAAIDHGDGSAVAGTYTADFLTSCFDDWALAERDALRTAAADAIEAAARSEAPAGMLTLARAAMTVEPLRESGYALAMRALVAQGERAEALRTYHRYAELLQRELGIEPGPELVAAYEAIRGAAGPDGERTQQPGVTTTHTLVGRGAELAALEQAWHDAGRDGARLALVVGDPGIGKSRLVAELARRAADGGASVATTRVYETAGRLPFGPVADWLRAGALRPVVSRLDPPWRREVARLVPDLFPQERGTRDGDASGRRLLFDALAMAISTMSPVLLVLDDLQWCDDDTVAFLGHLLHRARDSAVMVAATARSADLAARPSVTAFVHERIRSGQLVTVELGPLDRASTLRLATSLPGGPGDDDEAEQWWAETEGHPLFVVELARSSRAGSRQTLPPTVRAVITERLVVLSPNGRAAAEMAATIGREFSADILERAIGRSDDDLADQLDELWRLGIIREHPGGYDFTHDKLREVLTTGIGPARRRRLHRLVADALADLHAGDVDAVSSTLAAHLAAAGRHADAFAAYRRAARHALGLFALDEAIDCFGGAVGSIAELPHDAGRDRVERDVLIESGVPLVQQTGYGSARALATYERAAALSRRLGEPIEAEVLRGIGLAKLVRCEFGDAIEFAQQLLAGAGGDTVAVVEGQYLLGVCEAWRGRLASAAEHLAAAIDAYDPDAVRLHLTRFAQDPRPVVEVRLALVRHWQGRGDEAAELFARAREHADATGHPATLLYVVTYRCIGAIEEDDVDATAAAVAELATMLERHGEYAYFDQTRELIQAWIDQRRGQAGGMAGLERAVDRWRDGELRLHYTYGLRLLAQACVGAGRTDAGLAAVAEGIRFGRDHDQRYAEAPLRLVEATLRTGGGDVDCGRAALRDALDVARDQGNVWYEQRAAQRLARADT